VSSLRVWVGVVGLGVTRGEGRGGRGLVTWSQQPWGLFPGNISLRTQSNVGLQQGAACSGGSYGTRCRWRKCRNHQRHRCCCCCCRFDPSHIPFAHHKIMGPATRDKVQPLEVTTTSDVTPQGGFLSPCDGLGTKARTTRDGGGSYA
jgi:hypothetical protein